MEGALECTVEAPFPTVGCKPVIGVKGWLVQEWSLLERDPAVCMQRYRHCKGS